MSVKQRLTDFISYKKISKSEFCRAIGVSNAFVTSIVKSIQPDKIQRIALKYPELNTAWLLTGEGSMLKTTEPKVSVTQQFPLRTDRVVEVQSVPLYELDATAGLVSLFDIGGQYVPISHLSLPNLPPCDGALYVRGDSMYPLLKSGDIVLFRQVAPAYENILWGEMYLLSLAIDGEDYVTIKYIQKGDAEGYVRLVSHNPHHSPKDVPASAIRALALVKASVRYNTMG